MLSSGASQPTQKVSKWELESKDNIGRKDQRQEENMDDINCWIHPKRKERTEEINRGRNRGTELETWASSKAAVLDGGGKEKGREHVQCFGISLLFQTVILLRCFSIWYFHVKG